MPLTQIPLECLAIEHGPDLPFVQEIVPEVRWVEYKDVFFAIEPWLQPDTPVGHEREMVDDVVEALAQPLIARLVPPCEVERSLAMPQFAHCDRSREVPRRTLWNPSIVAKKRRVWYSSMKPWAALSCSLSASFLSSKSSSSAPLRMRHKPWCSPKLSRISASKSFIGKVSKQ